MTLVLVAALGMGGVSMWLLFKEAERLEMINENSQRKEAEVVAADTSLIVADLKLGVMEALRSFDEDSLHNLLLPWVSKNSLLEFAFAHDGRGAENVSYYPADIDLWIQPILRSENAWLWSDGVEESLVEDFSKSADWAATGYSANNLEQRSRIRQENFASQQLAQAFNSTLLEADDRSLVEALEGGDLSALEEVALAGEENWEWVESEGVSRWVGFVRYARLGRVAGASVNLNDLKNRFQDGLPGRSSFGGTAYALLDAKGQEVASTRNVGKLNEEEAEVSFAIGLGEELPGWSLVAYPVNRDVLSSAFLFATGLLIAVLVIALLFGGIWLGLQTRRSQLEAARRSSFVSNVSHELKTPLTTIRMYSELLEVGRVKDEKKRSRYLSTIASESQRLSRLVNNVLDFSRLDRGKTKVSMERLDLGLLVSSLVEIKREDLREASMEVEWVRPNEMIKAMGDRDGVAQVLGNLIDNAVKYASEGKWLGLEISERGDNVEIKVRDRGPGISGGKAKELFKPFERGDDRLVATQSGVGLGLSIAKGLADEMKGSLSYEATRGEGACFVFRLRKEVK
ncbi:MAG: HAMP domain-containing sensor histidine kinase [Verrucomicrobiota bacterium]